MRMVLVRWFFVRSNYLSVVSSDERGLRFRVSSWGLSSAVII